jgi:hypothetical protein
LFVSHFLNAATPKHAPDFYFQELPDYLQKHGYHVSVGLMNHVKGFTGWQTGNDSPADLSEKFLLPNRLDFRLEFLLMSRCVKTAAFFLNNISQKKNQLKNLFYWSFQVTQFRHIQ